MVDSSTGDLIACHECDLIYRTEKLEAGAKASCHRCGSLLYREIPNSMNRCIALFLSAFFLFFLANCFPFLSLTLGGLIEENILLSGGIALYHYGMGELGLLIFLTSIGFPFITIVGMLYILIPLRFGFEAPAMESVYRVVNKITPWSMISVFMLGVLIAIVKLQDLANVITGVSLYALIALLLVITAARANFDSRILWQFRDKKEPDINSGRKLLNCHTCGLLAEWINDHQNCTRCNTALHFRKHDSINRTWALLFTASLLIIPANVYPVMTVIRFGQGEPNTILSGIIHLIESGMWGLALIVFVASFVVPILKLIVLSFLLLTIQNKSGWRPRDRTALYRVTEVIGAWSMVDVFLVGLLSALVSLDALSTIKPGIGATFFGGVVVVTMFAAMTFEPRLIWDNMESSEDNHDNRILAESV